MKNKGDVRSVVVLGGGSFGTAIANMVADNGHRVCMWMRDTNLLAAIEKNRENSKYLPGYLLNPAITYTEDLQSACVNADIVFLAVPSKAFRTLLQQIKGYITPQHMLISTAKGIEEDRFLLMSQVIAEELPASRIGVLSGPNLAAEIAERKLTATVIASKDRLLIKEVQTLLSQSYFKVYGNDDVFGVELAGALKNIYAIAAGMADALGLGHNTKAMLITRSLAEMSRMAALLGGKPSTFLGLSGVGDLVVTCSSPLSRNYRLGFLLGQGYSVVAANAELKQTVEGVNTVKVVYNKAQQLQIYMPLVTALYQVLYEHQALKTVITGLMLSEHADDVEFSASV